MYTCMCVYTCVCVCVQYLAYEKGQCKGYQAHMQ